jgi:FdhD protein
MSAPLVEEAIVGLSVNGTASFEWRCTPHDLEALVIGRLFISGMINRPDDLHMTVEPVADGRIQVAARVDASRSRVGPADARVLGVPSPEIFTTLFRDLFNTVDARHESGGMHAAAATDGIRIIKQVEDVGRHNTIDKIVGMLLLSSLSFGQHGLLTSSRVSGEIAHKTARAGFAWLASRSIPTTLAVRFAKQAGLPIIGRAASRNSHVYQV